MKVFAGNVEYYLSKKGTGSVAANFGLLDVPVEVEQEILGLIKMAEGIDGFGDETDPPYMEDYGLSLMMNQMKKQCSTTFTVKMRVWI